MAWLACVLGAQVVAACACGDAEPLHAVVAPCHGEPTQNLSPPCCCVEARTDWAEPARAVAAGPQLVAAPMASLHLPEPATCAVASVEAPALPILASNPLAAPLRL